MIQIEIDSGSGFCFGVTTAIKKAEEELSPAPQHPTPNTQHPTPITQQEGTKASPSGARSEGALSVGSIIEHQRFGIGTVLRIEGTGENTKATVEFRNAGIQQLFLKFAKYKIIS